MTPWTPETLAAHVDGFLRATLTREQWAPHTSHLAVTTVLCRGRPLPAALEAVRTGIQTINAAIGVPAEAYHETVTCFYVRLVHRVVLRRDDGQADATLVGAVTELLGSDKDARLSIWRRCYTAPEALLASELARVEWVAPTLLSVEACADVLVGGSKAD